MSESLWGAGGHTSLDTQAHAGTTRTHGSHRRTSQPSKPNDTPVATGAPPESFDRYRVLVYPVGTVPFLCNPVPFLSRNMVGFRHFSDNLYCYGSEERLCPHPTASAGDHPGECYWFRSNGAPITHADMDVRPRSQWQGDVWDAVRAGAVDRDAFTRFDARAAATCVRNKHLLILGESTTRDLYYAFAAAVGLKADHSYCMNLSPQKPICRKVTDGDGSTRVSFQFLSRSNATREMLVTRELVAARPPDVVFVYCMAYDWMGTLAGDSESDAMGAACMQNIDENILTANPRAQVYLLGPTFPPGWVEAYGNRTLPQSRMSRIFRSINRATGISCVRKADGVYKVVSTRDIHGPIDRYNVVGHRKRDMIHPYENAHTPVVQLMLNHMCGSHSKLQGGAQASEVRGRSFG